MLKLPQQLQSRAKSNATMQNGERTKQNPPKLVVGTDA